MPVSDKRIANRRNAENGSGPKTAEGKLRSSKNAFKHGLLSRAVVLTGQFKEEEEEYVTLSSRLVDCYQPQGAQEELLVETIASCYWRKRRALKCELSEIELAKYNATNKRSGNDRYDPRNETQLRAESESFDRELTCLDACTKEATDNNYLSAASLRKLEELFSSDSHVACCTAYSTLAQLVAVRSGEEGGNIPSIENCQYNILEALKWLRWWTSAKENIKNKRSSLDHLAKIESQTLPPIEAVDRILRYESAIDRQLYRAIAMLDHLQSRRRGNAVPRLTS